MTDLKQSQRLRDVIFRLSAIVIDEGLTKKQHYIYCVIAPLLNSYGVFHPNGILPTVLFHISLREWIVQNFGF